MADSGDARREEMIAYYRARAPEYDEWWLRLGRYDRGAEGNARWFAEADEVRAALAAEPLTGDVLELACGTGNWTVELARHANSITCVDASPEVIAINRARVAGLGGPVPVRYIEHDLFAWQPDRQYDAVFFGFWLSHVPAERFEAFWAMVARALRPGGRAFFVDSLEDPSASARDQQGEDRRGHETVRRLNDGRAFTIVKVYYDPAGLQQQLQALGWQMRVGRTARFFLHGSGTRRET
jgi:demethylmenaquinone methyltransferase/2-methoxy-6-polyprenyl-1,4-benzoquinol methylase